jgi:hypothetical protein
VLPIEARSGVDRAGQARSPPRFVMSRRGNDLARRHPWMAALRAIRFNPAVRALYGRVVTRHPQRKALAVGHATPRLLHLVFALWQSGRRFNPEHDPWQAPAHVAGSDTSLSLGGRGRDQQDQAAGHKPEPVPARKVVTAACADSVAEAEAVGETTFIEFDHLKRKLSLARVLDQPGLSARLRGSGPQRRGACPLHRGDGRGRTFGLEPAPRHGTAKRTVDGPPPRTRAGGVVRRARRERSSNRSYRPSSPRRGLTFIVPSVAVDFCRRGG